MHHELDLTLGGGATADGVPWFGLRLRWKREGDRRGSKQESCETRDLDGQTSDDLGSLLPPEAARSQAAAEKQSDRGACVETKPGAS